MKSITITALAMSDDPSRNMAYFEQILRNGYIEIESFYSQELFSELARIALSTDFDNQKSCSPGGDLRNLALNVTLVNLLRDLASLKLNYFRDEQMSQAFSGETHMHIAKKGSAHIERSRLYMDYHFDCSCVNAVLPLKLPDRLTEPPTGLHMYKNQRTTSRLGVRARLLRYLINKYPWSPLLKLLYPPAFIQYQINSLYIFFGDLSLHGVEPVSKGERVTMFISYE